MGKEIAGNENTKDIPFGMNKYFNKNVLPKGIQCIRKVITRKTPNKQSEGETVLYVFDGQGTIIINHESFRLKKGIFIWLGPFHNYTITPEKDSAIELEELHTNSGAYMYMLSCPYLKIKKMLIPQYPAVVSLNREEQNLVKQIIEPLENIKSDENYYAAKWKILLIMQLFGLLMTKFFEKKYYK